MATDHIRYDVLTRDALRGVLKRVLSDAAAHGLPGEHHFFITFLSTAEGVKLSPRLLAQYPDEMTIILQHQFWDLAVHDDRFEVGLSFGGIPERLAVPFAAIKSFFDPSVQFGLQFETADAATETVVDAVEMPAKNLPASPAPSALAGPASQPSLPRRPRSRRNRARARKSCASIASARSKPQREIGVLGGALIRAIAIACAPSRQGAGGKLAYCMMHSISSPCSCIDRALRCRNAR